MTNPQRPRDAIARFTLVAANIPETEGGYGRLSETNPIISGGAGADQFFFGAIRTFTPPELKQKNALWPTMGDGQLKVDLGVEEMPFVFTTVRYHPGIRALYGKYVQFQLKAGLWQGDTRRHSNYLIDCIGNIESVSGSQVSTGELPEGITVMMNCSRYRESIDERTYIDINVSGFKRIIDGEDQLKELRRFLLGSE